MRRIKSLYDVFGSGDTLTITRPEAADDVPLTPLEEWAIAASDLLEGRRQMVLFDGEREAVENVLIAGRKYGYGNLIAHLKRAWAEMLMQEHGMSEVEALRAADTSAYSLRAVPEGAPE